MKRFLYITLAMFTLTGVFVGLGHLADYSIYKQDLRICMKEGSRQDCEEKLK